MQASSHSSHGIIFNIQRFSIHDGPGIRTTLFFKGCNLRCLWCHNPESIQQDLQIQYYPEKCILCGGCTAVCPQHAHRLENEQHVYLRDLCQLCQACVSECFADALVLSGKEYRVEEVIAEIQKDSDYFSSSAGGVTFSGGEPLLQAGFLTNILLECKRLGIHCAIDTAGNIPWQTFQEIAPLTDLFLFDLKAFDPVIHRRATGVGNRLIFENLQRLVQLGKSIWVRIPIVPGFNDGLDEIDAMTAFLQSLGGIERVELLPYHSLGSEKYAGLGCDYPAAGIPIPCQGDLALIRKLFADRKLPVHIMQ